MEARSRSFVTEYFEPFTRYDLRSLLADDVAIDKAPRPVRWAVLSGLCLLAWYAEMFASFAPGVPLYDRAIMRALMLARFFLHVTVYPLIAMAWTVIFIAWGWFSIYPVTVQ